MQVTVTTQAFPEGLAEARDYRAIFQRDILGSVVPVYEAIVADAKSTTKSQAVAGAYRVGTAVTGEGVGVWVENQHPLFSILEDGTRPHFMPPAWRPIAPLRVWAQARGMNEYAVQRKIATVGFMHPGTRAQKMVANAYRQHESEVRQALQEGTYAFALDSLGGGA